MEGWVGEGEDLKFNFRLDFRTLPTPLFKLSGSKEKDMQIAYRVDETTVNYMKCQWIQGRAHASDFHSRIIRLTKFICKRNPVMRITARQLCELNTMEINRSWLLHWVVALRELNTLNWCCDVHKGESWCVTDQKSESISRAKQTATPVSIWVRIFQAVVLRPSLCHWQPLDNKHTSNPSNNSKRTQLEFTNHVGSKPIDEGTRVTTAFPNCHGYFQNWFLTGFLKESLAFYSERFEWI